MNSPWSFNPEPFDNEQEFRSPLPGGYEAEVNEQEWEGFVGASLRGGLPFRSGARPSGQRIPRGMVRQPLKLSPNWVRPGGIKLGGGLPYIRFPIYPINSGWPYPAYPERSWDRPGPGAYSPPHQEPTEAPSEYVSWVQNCLNQLLGLSLPLDGILNPATRSAIRLFQERQGLPITGLICTETGQSLAATCRGETANSESEILLKAALAKGIKPKSFDARQKPMVKGLRTSPKQTGDAKCQEIITETIVNWGRYSDVIPPSQIPVIAKLADIVVSSFQQYACPPFRVVQFIGHADKDWQGTKKEWEVSRDRADAVRRAFSRAAQDILRIKKMKPLEKDVRWEGYARGAKDMIAGPYNPANRRVVIKLIRSGPVIPPPSQVTPDTLERRIERLLNLLKTRRVNPDSTGGRTNRAKCLLMKMLNPNVVDVFVDGGVANQTINGMTPKYHECLIPGRNVGWLGNYDGTKKPMPNTEFVKFLATVRPILMGPGFLPTQIDNHVLEVLGQVILRIDLGIEMVDAYLNRMNMMSDPIVKMLLGKDGYAGDVARKRLQKLYRNNLDNENNIYSCYR